MIAGVRFGVLLVFEIMCDIFFVVGNGVEVGPTFFEVFFHQMFADVIGLADRKGN